MRVLVISPVARPGNERLPLGALASEARPDTALEKVYLDRGPPCVEGELDRVLVAPGVVARACEGQQEGFDAVMIYCAADPGLHAARQAVHIPVVGAGQAGMQVGALLGHRFSLVTPGSSLIAFWENQTHVYGLEGKLASVRAVDIPVLELNRSEDVSIDAFVQASIRAIEDDHADVIVLGCTGTTGWGKRIMQEVAHGGYSGIPVVEPAICALKLCESLVDMGLAQSRRRYPFPGLKRLIGYDRLYELLATPRPS